METTKIGNKIKKIRELKSFTQEHMATELNMSQAGYSKIENGETDVSLSKIESIAKVLGVSLNTILDFDEGLIFNINQNATDNQAGLIIGLENFEKERKLYEAQITELKNTIKDKEVIIDLLKEKLDKK